MRESSRLSIFGRVSHSCPVNWEARFRRCQLLSALFLTCVAVSSIFLADYSSCQEVSFTPRHDAISSEKKRVKRKQTPQVDVKKAQPLYSLARYNLLFQEMCRLLEADRRRDRVYRVCKAAVEEEQGCSSCRALLRQIAQSCSPKAQLKKAPAPKPAPSPTPAEAPAGADGSPESSDSGTESPSELQAVQATSTNLPKEPQPRRYPRTDLVDIVSRLSDGLQEFGPGPGPVFDALKSLESHLMGLEDLTPGERDYYGVLLTYLFSAWEGRPDSPLSAGTPSPAEIAELFQ